MVIKSGCRTLQRILGLYCNAFRTHSNLPKHMRHPFCLLQWPVPWQILQSPVDAHVALAPDTHTSYLPESELGLNIWRIVVHISPTSPKVDALQKLVRKNDHKASMAVDDKNVLGVCTWCWCDIGGGVWAPLSPLAKRCWIGWSWPLDLTSWPWNQWFPTIGRSLASLWQQTLHQGWQLLNHSYVVFHFIICSNVSHVQYQGPMLRVIYLHVFMTKTCEAAWIEAQADALLFLISDIFAALPFGWCLPNRTMLPSQFGGGWVSDWSWRALLLQHLPLAQKVFITSTSLVVIVIWVGQTRVCSMDELWMT